MEMEHDGATNGRLTIRTAIAELQALAEELPNGEDSNIVLAMDVGGWSGDRIIERVFLEASDLVAIEGRVQIDTETAGVSTVEAEARSVEAADKAEAARIQANAEAAAQLRPFKAQRKTG